MSDNIKVVVKVRPLIGREIDDGAPVRWRAGNNTLHQLDLDSGGVITPGYTFDKVYGIDTQTQEVYDNIAKPIVEAAIGGINGTIFAYGQTSSGKTYTMMGDENTPGIIPLAVHDIFDTIKNKSSSRDFLLRVSYIEIYNETIKDLLDITKAKIKICETIHGAVKVDASEKVTSTPEEVLAIMREGEINRQCGATNMNEKSSRSHTIFQITIESREHTDEGDEDVACVNVSQLNLVDLAGSERAGQTGATGVRFKEGTHINKSLSALGLVIMQLSEDPNKFINYRDSKLTRILQNSLGGNAKTSIICAVTPAAVEETISTLQFANRAKAIKNKPEVNAVATNATMLQSLTKKLASLQYELDNKRHLEHDNEKLLRKIKELQKQILFGMTRPSDVVNRRKTWCAPRRATIGGNMPSIEEEDVLRTSHQSFFTPGLKFTQRTHSVGQFVTKRRSQDISDIREEDRDVEQITPPARRKNIGFTEEVITLDDSDDEKPSNQSCSPYHKCYETSKTPPCVLRDKARKAELKYNDLSELTEREKIYSPKTVELMERLDKNSFDLAITKEEFDKAKDLCSEKDKEIALLKYTVIEYKKNIEEHAKIKVSLEDAIQNYQTRLTDLEVCLDNFKHKAKQREVELLSLLDEKNASNHHDKSQPNEKAPSMEISTFLNLSRDISLVNSDAETSISPDGVSVKQCSTNDIHILHEQIIEKNDLIRELNKKLANSQQSVKMYSEELEISNKDKTNTESVFCNFKEIITDLNNKLEKANQDVKGYENLVSELKRQLLENDSYATDKLTSNNEEIRSIINGFKQIMELQNKTSTSFDTSTNEKFEGACAPITGSKSKEMNIRENDIEELRQLYHFNEHHIKSLKNENAELLKFKHELIIDNEKLSADAMLSADQVKSLQHQVDEMNMKQKQLLVDIAELQKGKDDAVVKNKYLYCEIDALKQISEECTKKTALLETVNTEVQNLKSQLCQSSEELSNKATLFDTMNTEVESLRSDLYQSKEELSNRTASLEVLNTEVKTLRSQLNKNNEKLSIKVLSFEALNTELKNLRSQFNQKNEELSNKTACLEALNTEMENMRSQLNENDEKYNHITNTSHTLLKDNEVLKFKLHEVEMKLTETKKESTEKESIINCLNNELAVCNKSLKEVKVQEGNLISELDSLRKVQEEFMGNVAQKDATIQTLNDREQMLKTDITSLNQELNYKNIQVQDLNNELTISKIEIARLNTEIEGNYSSLREDKERLDECLKTKEAEIDVLQETINVLKQQVEDLNKNVLTRKEIKQKESILDVMSSKIKIMFKTIEKPDDITLRLDDVNVMLTKIGDWINLTKQQTSAIDNEKKVIIKNLEQQVFLLAGSVKTLETLLQNKEHVLESLQKACNESSIEISRLMNLNCDANNSLIQFESLFKTLQNTVIHKTMQFNKMTTDLEHIVLEKLSKCDVSVINLNKKINRIYENEPLCTKRNIHELRYSNKSTKPPTLVELSIQRVNESILKHNERTEKTKHYINSGTQVDSDLTVTAESYATSVNDQLRQENAELLLKIYSLEKTNTHLEEGNQQVKEEVKMLLSLADELHKLLSKHRTQLSTLTATTYAENKLLKTKLKALHHHHNRLHSVCEREVPELRQSLCTLQSMLQSDLNQSTALSKYVVMHECDSTINDDTKDPPSLHATEISMSKFSLATLGSDMMLGNNYTLGPSANSTMINQDDMVRGSVTICDNLDVTEIQRTGEISHQAEDKVLCFEAEEAVSLGLPRCCSTKIGNVAVTNVNLKQETCQSSKEAINEELAMHSENCVIKHAYNAVAKLLLDRENDIENYLKKLEVEQQDKRLMKEELQQITDLQVAVSDKALQIKKLHKVIEDMKKTTLQLQTENESLSNDVMDLVTENDSLKSKLQFIKSEKSAQSQNYLEYTHKDQIVSADKAVQTHETSEKNMLLVLNDSPTNINDESVDMLCNINTNTSRYDKFCSLQNELQASREDCKMLSQQVSTMGEHLENLIGSQVHTQNNLSIYQKNISKNGSLQNANYNSDYDNDKQECINFIDSCLATKKINCENNTFNRDGPIIDLIRFLYDTMWTKHSNELENLLNKLTQFEEDKVKLQTELKTLSENYNNSNEKLKIEIECHNAVNMKMDELKEIMRTVQNQTDMSVSDVNSKWQLLFKNILTPLDIVFDSSTSEIFENLFVSIQQEYENKIISSNTKCAQFETQASELTIELNRVRERLETLNQEYILDKKELELLKETKCRLSEITSAVTRDLVSKEERLRNIVAEYSQALNMSLPTVEIVAQMFAGFENNIKALTKNKNSTIDTMRAQNIDLEDKVKTITSQLKDIQVEVQTLKSENSCLQEKVLQAELEFTKLLSLNTILTAENKELTTSLESGACRMGEQKKDLDEMKRQLEKVQCENQYLGASLQEWKNKIAIGNEELTQAKNLLNDKSKELLRLEKNVITHQKTTDIQANMCKRLHKEKEEMEGQLKCKSDIIEQLSTKCSSLQAELDDLRSLKSTLELQLPDIHSENDGSNKSSRNSLDTVRTETRKRRQSVYDLHRTIADIEENTSPEQDHPDKIFVNFTSTKDLFTDSKPGSQRNSMESNSKQDFRSGTFVDNVSECDEDRVTQRRRRRQSIHDINRSSSVQLMLGSKEDLSQLNELQTENRQLKEEIDRLKATIESGPAPSGYLKGETENLRQELSSCRKQYEELQKEFKELDEECEMCAASLRERDEQCLKLGRIKADLERQLAEMKKHVGGGDAHSNVTTRPTVDAQVNTDMDVKKWHSAVVDRMSFDAEVDKRKKLAKSVEELRSKNKELKETIADLKNQITQCAPTDRREVNELRSELESCRKQYKELQEQYKQLDEECEMCADGLKERDEQCLKLGRIKATLEAKVQELQQSLNAASSVQQSARKKRQSSHDVNRASEVPTKDVGTNTVGGNLSALGVDHMTFEAERERRRRLQGTLEQLKAKNSELSGQLRRLQQTHVNESTVDMLQAAPDKDLIHRQNTEIQQLRCRVEDLERRKQQLEQYMQSVVSAPPSPAPTLVMPPPPSTILVATGSAIVQNQQLCDFMKENQRLKKINAKLINLCKKRGKDCDDNQENVEPH